MNTKSDNAILIAAYGTLRRPYGNSRLLDRGNNWIGTGVTIKKYQMFATGIPYVVNDPDEDPKNKTKITVDVWEVDEKMLESADRLEGHPSWYKRELIKVKMEGGSTKECWLYFNNNKSGTPVPSGNYADYRPTR